MKPLTARNGIVVQINDDGYLHATRNGMTEATGSPAGIHALREFFTGREAPLSLPAKPGTVIAIGAWWLVRLEPHEGNGPGCWELLPARDEKTRESMERAHVKAQCVYSDEWVLAEAEQEGSLVVVSEPVDAGAEK